MAVKPRNLDLPTLNKIHLQNPEIGKALQKILEYINKNVTPVQGNKVK